MMLLDRYLIREFTRWFGLILSVFVLLYLLVDFFGRLRMFLSNNALPSQMAAYFLYNLPMIVSLTLPAAIAARVAGSIAQMMLLATFLCAACCLAGLTLSFAPDLPAGPVIIILAGALYVLTVGAAWLRQRFGGSGSRAGE